MQCSTVKLNRTRHVSYLTFSILRVRHVPWVCSLKRFLIPNSSPLWTPSPWTASKYRRELSLPTTELCNCWNTQGGEMYGNVAVKISWDMTVKCWHMGSACGVKKQKNWQCKSRRCITTCTIYVLLICASKFTFPTGFTSFS